jgi:hypothetical protein
MLHWRELTTVESHISKIFNALEMIPTHVYECCSSDDTGAEIFRKGP